MADLATLRLPVFLPGNNRDWQKVDGVATITDDGKIVVTVEPHKAEMLVLMAKNDLLFQLSFDYRMDEATLEKINAKHQEKTDG